MNCSITTLVIGIGSVAEIEEKDSESLSIMSYNGTMKTEELTPTAPLVTLSARLLDADFREGDQIGFEAALAELLARCEFPFSDEATIKDLGGNRWSVAGYVDSQNSFGAMLRMNYTVTIRDEGQKWQLEDIDLQEP